MRTLVLALCGLLSLAEVTPGQDRQRSEEAIRPLVVMLDVKVAGTDDYGAGIIAAVVSDRLYIATANHVVRKEGKDATAITVGFSWLPGETRSARLLATYDEQLDLAVILVDKASELAIPPLPFNNVALASSLNKGDLVFPMGYPNRQPWSTRALPDAIASVQDGLRFDTNYLVPGNSGGALLTSNWRVAGLVTERSGGQGTAIPIERVMAKLRGWNYQVQWKPGEAVAAPVPSRSAGASSPPKLTPGTYEIQLLEVAPVNAQAVIPATGLRRSWSPSLGPGFLTLDVNINQVPILQLRRQSVPYRPRSGEGLARVNLKAGEELVVSMQGASTSNIGGRHGARHLAQEALGEGSRVAVNMVFPNDEAEFVFYFSVVRK